MTHHVLPLCQRGQFACLALLMDLYSRRVVGWDVRGDMTTDLVLAASPVCNPLTQ
ncbi:MAG: hypothetical protein R3C18_11110 [Planctomycetaceae bacterium]